MCLCWTLVTSSAFFWGPRKRAENIETSKKKASTFFCSIWGFRHVECWKVRFLPPLRTGFGKGPEENQCKRWEVLAHVEHQKTIRAQFYQTPFLNPGLPFTDPNPILKFFFRSLFQKLSKHVPLPSVAETRTDRRAGRHPRNVWCGCEQFWQRSCM